MTHRPHPSPPAPDPRWQALDLVQAAMEPLGLRDRDIVVLRGLLTFLPADQWDGALMVFASNATLQQRCGGMDERTLRRRLVRLCAVGLIARRQSPNRKRFVVRDETGAAVVSYGFDLAPLRASLDQLAMIVDEARRVALKIKALKSLLSDRLYQLALRGCQPETPLAETAKLLRRKCSVLELEAALQGLSDDSKAEPDMTAHDSPVLTDSNGQNDRHIQSSKKESLEKKRAEHRPNALTLDECLESARSAVEFAPVRPRSWDDVSVLAQSLAPAIGVDGGQWQRTRAVLGDHGASLAILGLVEAYSRIKDIPRYLAALSAKAASGRLDLARMFRSLTGKVRFPAGNALPA